MDSIIRKYNAAAENKKNFTDLPAEAQTVIASISFQYGSNLGVRAPKFWKAAKAQDWKGCVAILNNYGDAYNRKKKRSGVAGKNKMIKNLTFAVLLSVSMLGCEARHQATIGVVYNRELADALQRRDVFDKKRAVLTFDSGAVANTCGEYLRLVGSSPIKEDVTNQLSKGEYILCGALALVGDNKLATGAREVAFGQALATRLDLRSFPSSLFQMLDEHKYSLNQLDGAAVKLGPMAAVYETKDTHFQLEVVATLDINHNAKTDWLLWLADEARTGNYRQYQTLIIYDASDSGVLRATPFVGVSKTESRKAP